ncbi:MAG TPA: hypothetical protein VMH39_17715, partial [Gemmatimonadaceae bacterium]|nr:hypothetical protein [Gemmatimonadaceae bacterium]
MAGLTVRVRAAALALLTAGAVAPRVGAAQTRPAAPAAAPATLPGRLTDQEFFAFINDVSEPNGTFPSDNLLSNELTYQQVIPTLLQRTRPGGVYLGVGPEQNFTYIAALQPRMAIIFDIRRGNLLLHLVYKSLIELSPDRAEFLSRMYSRPRPAGLDTASRVAALFSAIEPEALDTALFRRNRAAVIDHLTKDHGFALSPGDIDGIKYIYDAFCSAGPALDYNYPNIGRIGGGYRPTYADLMLADDGHGVERSYLATEANYRVLRALELDNMLVPVVGNFAGPKAIVAVGAYLRAHHATATAFYTSNVEQYLFQQFDDWSKFYTNVNAV